MLRAGRDERHIGAVYAAFRDDATPIFTASHAFEDKAHKMS